MKTTTTRNYSLFISDTSNRVITDKDKRRLKLLRLSMKKYGFLPFPILVRRSGDKLKVIDGQHRLVVAQELGLQLMYIETDRDDIVISECAAGQSPWNIRDYVASNAARGNKHYQELLAFADEHSMPLARCATLLRGRVGDGGIGGAAVQDGNFVVKDRVFAERVATIVKVVAQFSKFARSSNSVAAIARFVRVPQFSDEQLMKRIAAHPHMLKNQPTLEAFSDMYEAIYNHASRSRIPLAFMAKEVASKRADLGSMNKSRKTPVAVAA